MKKQFLIILTILLIIVAFVSYYIYNNIRIQQLSEKTNQEYEIYYDKEILGTDLISIINKTIDYNEKNAIDKDENNLYYIENDTDSIKIYIKFLEDDRTIPMEDIAEKNTENFVKYFATATFKCTKIDYHQKTKSVKELYFEQIQI